MTPRPFRFGVEMMAPFEGSTWADSARELEALGYSTLFAPDHFDEGYGPITAMATAAAATTSLRVATAVFAADFRHPAVLARELASIDQLSEGRLEVGLGAGYQINDYAGSGIVMDPPKVRVDRLIEYVAVLRGLFAEGPFDFAGEHYRVTALDGSPAPHRPGGPPIFVAGGGRRAADAHLCREARGHHRRQPVPALERAGRGIGRGRTPLAHRHQARVDPRGRRRQDVRAGDPCLVARRSRDRRRADCRRAAHRGLRRERPRAWRWPP